MLSCLAGSSAISAGTVTAPSTAFGAYAGPTNFTALGELDQLVGFQVPYAMDFLDGSTWQSISHPAWPVNQWLGRGYKMVWAVPIIPNTGGSLSAGAAGHYNQYFASLASYLVSKGQGSSIIRIGWEFNGGWFAWAAGGKPLAFVEYWRNIVNSMRSVKGANFSFEWNPTRGDQGVGNLAEYYPGNQYVNVIGLDVYDVEWQNYPGQQAEWQHIVTEPYGLNWLASFAASHGKPIALPEWGLGWNGGGMVGGGDDAYFIEQMASWISDHDCIATTYWDYGTSRVAGGHNPLVAAALKADFG